MLGDNLSIQPAIKPNESSNSDSITPAKQNKKIRPLMFTLSPKEDLILLASKYNHPEHSWEQISELILTNYNCVIPSDICCERYEMFLKRILLKEQSKSLLKLFDKDSWRKGLNNEEKIPENFIFAYRELKEKAGQNIDLISLKCLENYQKRLVGKLFGLQKLQKTKTIAKPLQSEKSKSGQQRKDRAFKVQQFKEQMFRVIKQHTEGVLTEQIIEQKIEQLMLSIVQSVNQKVLQLQGSKEQTIGNGLQVIRWMRKYGLLERRRRVFQIYLEERGINEQNYYEIKTIFQQVDLQFNYRPRGTNEVSANSEFAGVYAQGSKEFHSQQGVAEAVQECKKKSLSQPEFSKQYLQLMPQLDIQKYLQLYEQLQVKQQQPQECLQQSKAAEPANLSGQLRGQPNSHKVQPPVQEQVGSDAQIGGQKEQAPTNNGIQILSNFQITILNSNSAVVNLPNQPQPEVKTEVKEEEEVKVQADSEPVRRNRFAGRFRSANRKKPPKTAGKVWLIIND